MSNNKKFGFSGSAKTKICLEQASDTNPYICTKQYLSGYDTLDLASNVSFIDVLLLLFKLELPSKEERQLLEVLMIGLINAGPRHPASRAAMSAGISKANTEHILPISLTVLGGSQGGAIEVGEAYKFIQSNQNQEVDDLVKQSSDIEGDRFAPGFGKIYGEKDLFIQSLGNLIQTKFQTGKCFNWAIKLSEKLSANNSGLLDVGLAAAVFCDLRIGHRESIALYQFVRAPGLIAHGLEQTHRPINDIPLLEDSNYVYPHSK